VFMNGKFQRELESTNLLLLMHGKEATHLQTIQQIENNNWFFSPKRGPSRPFNFFGYMPSSGMNRLADSIIGPKDREPYNHTMVVSTNLPIIQTRIAAPTIAHAYFLLFYIY
jgi:hypothetical protein